ncbi:serine/threonine protein kinase [Streptomyces camponoticapitis]|uniref:non-specific serine/threonine protein kinase n=1 Tax=Streptomyces camponoticapitis TaxID=1616125 RepID=A0ABQ2E8L5_9ACTN|nr:PASTA domain-containing protein [Streptomyces camponoticapitis]GGJ96327.1 serine/threonine protein kinase [Streptomyces camponoticapitis]
MDTTLRDPLVGQVLDGRYRVDGRIAVGGMATVYRAVDTRLDRVLALKVMHPALATDSVFVERFIREAKSVARLAHPNVVGVFDQGAEGAYVYLAMEYVEGCTLRDVLRERGALQPRAALDILEPMLAALGAAHRAGFIHRDIKPENVLIGDDGRVKVADFGLVRAIGSVTDTTGTILGTVSYLAPEQIEYGTSDTRVDVYACGVVLHEMLTGAKPHGGDTPAQVLYLHLNEDVPAPSAAVPGMAIGLDELVAAATARDPEARPEDAVALLAMTRRTRAALDDAQLDAMPPQATTATEKTTSAPAGTKDSAGGASAGGASEPSQDSHDSIDGGAGRAQDASLASYAPSAGAPATRTADGPGDGSDDRTSVIPRLVRSQVAPDGSGAPDPAASLGDDQVRRTSRLTMPPPGPPAPPQRPPVRRRAGRSASGPRRGIVAIVVGALLVLGVGVGVWYINSGQFTRVPSVLGQTEQVAKKRLGDAGLDAKVEKDFSGTFERGTVMRTDPEPRSRIRGNGSVTLVISRGPEIVRVPDLAGKSLADAKDALKEAGLAPGVITRSFDQETGQGDIIRTQPKAGTELRPDAGVALVVSKGSPVHMPDVTGQPEEEATASLEDAGLDVKIAAERVNSPEDEGSVAKQSAKEGTRLARGDSVTLTISKGPRMIAVPDVTGRSIDAARTELSEAGFEVKVDRSFPFLDDTVSKQSVEGGEEAPEGSTITLTTKGI